MMTAGLAVDKQVVINNNSSCVFSYSPPPLLSTALSLSLSLSLFLSLSLSLYLQLVTSTDTVIGLFWASVRFVMQVYVAVVMFVKF